MVEPDNELLKKQLKENITDSGIEELIITKQKLEEKDDKIAELEKEKKELEDLLKRKMADYENYKRRKESELKDKEIFGNQKLVEDVLPIVDNFEKAIESAETNSDFDALFDGIKLIEKQFKQVLSKYKVEPIKSVGKEFDPNLHDALMIDENGEHEVDTVIKEWQKGYMMAERIIRHAQVVVGKGKPASFTTDQKSDSDAQDEPLENSADLTDNTENKAEANGKDDAELNSEYIPPKGSDS
jgi:molecular chaperone GrpE